MSNVGEWISDVEGAWGPYSKPGEYKPCQDPIVEAVRDKLKERSEFGIKKYNSTLDADNKSNFLNHIQQELMDACNYIEKEMKLTKYLVSQFPNDAELGAEIRKIYG